MMRLQSVSAHQLRSVKYVDVEDCTAVRALQHYLSETLELLPSITFHILHSYTRRLSCSADEIDQGCDPVTQSATLETRLAGSYAS